MQSAETPIVPAILSGGSGARLWPVSRKDFARRRTPVLGGEGAASPGAGRKLDGGADRRRLIDRENESICPPLGCAHRLANPGKIPVEIIGVQTGACLEEDDIIRIEDDFGRR